MDHTEKPDKTRRQIFEPFPNQRPDPKERERIREEELAQFASAFGSAPPEPVDE